MILILHLVCILCILELLLLNYDCIFEGSENHLKRLGTERVKLAMHVLIKTPIHLEKHGVLWIIGYIAHCGECWFFWPITRASFQSETSWFYEFLFYISYLWILEKQVIWNLKNPGRHWKIKLAKELIQWKLKVIVAGNLHQNMKMKNLNSWTHMMIWVDQGVRRYRR